MNVSPYVDGARPKQSSHSVGHRIETVRRADTAHGVCTWQATASRTEIPIVTEQAILRPEAGAPPSYPCWCRGQRVKRAQEGGRRVACTQLAVSDESMNKLLQNIVRLLQAVDNTDFEFDIEQTVQRRSIARRPAPRPRRQRRRPNSSLSADRDSEGLRGREKFAARRRMKRLNRLLKQAERRGVSLNELLADEPPLVRQYDDGGSAATIVVEGDDAELEWTAGDDTVVVRCEAHTEEFQLPFAVETVERHRKHRITEFRLSAEAPHE